MKIECIVEKVFNAVSKTEKISGKNLSLPVLSNILFEVEKNKLILKATNLEIGIESDVSVNTESGVGEKFALPSQTLLSFLSNLDKNKTISFSNEKDTKKIHLVSGDAEAYINTVDHQDFPTINKIKKEKGIKIRSEDLALGIRSVVFSASNSTIRPELSSVYLFVENGNMVFVSTDSFRLAEKKIKAPGVKEAQPVILPSKNAIEIARLAEFEKGGDVEIVLGKNQTAFYFQNDYLVSRTVEGNFPDYRQIIPKEGKTIATVLKADFSKAIKTSITFSDNFYQISFRINPIKKSFEIFSKNNDLGSNVFRLKGALEGEATEISFNHKYINDCMQIINQDSVVLSLNGAGKPMIIRGLSDTSYLYLVMPMNK